MNRTRENLQRMSSEDLVELMVRGGAEVLARLEHGVFLHARRQLIFVRRAPVLDGPELLDALRAAGIGPSRFDRLLSEVQPASAMQVEPSPASRGAIVPRVGDQS
jgi:hypothetical protein